MNKKLLAILLIFFTCILPALAVKKVKIGDLYYNLNPDDRTAEVTSQNNSNPYWKTNITSANIPSSIEYRSTTYRVTSIGKSAFMDCKELTSVTIPNGVKNIESNAFWGGSRLTSIIIPNSVSHIGDFAFEFCGGFYVENDNRYYTSIDGVLFTKDKATLVRYPNDKKMVSYSIPYGVTHIGRGAFSESTFLKYVTIPHSVTTIENNSFQYCEGLLSIEIPNSVTSIGSRAFYYCSGLTSVTIPNSVTYIGDGAFSECGSLISVTIPSKITNLKDYTFYGCTSLKKIHYPQGLNVYNLNTPAAKYAYNPSDSSADPASSSSTSSSKTNVATNKTSQTNATQPSTPTTKPLSTTSTIPISKPICTILYPSDENTYYSKSPISMRYKVENLSEGQTIEYYVDDPKKSVPIQGTKGVRIEQGAELKIEMQQYGKHVVGIRVVDTYGMRSEDTRNFEFKSVHKPTLHVFAVGVNKYKAEGFTKLDYAEQDAKDFTNVIMEMADKNMYKKVDTTLILGSAATTFNLQERLTQLSNQVEPNDVVMIFFSGHGLKENKKSYFISSDAIRPYQGLDMEFIRNRADEMECPVFVFMDACHSGPGNDKTKGVIEPIIVADKGVIGFYSCKSGQQSIEKKEYKNGVFTYVLVRGLKGAADVDEDGYISISDLENYVKKQVPSLSERKQTPVVLNSEVGDAILFRIKKK